MSFDLNQNMNQDEGLASDDEDNKGKVTTCITHYSVWKPMKY